MDGFYSFTHSRNIYWSSGLGTDVRTAKSAVILAPSLCLPDPCLEGEDTVNDCTR